MIRTRLTDQLGLSHPVISAPMAKAAGGALASAVTDAGGLGLIGGAYGEPDWLAEQYKHAGNTRVGAGFITWSLAKQPTLLTQALAHDPAVMMLSFADPMPFADEIHRAEVPLMVQVQTRAYAERAIDAGAAIIVAQGAEAGGHGLKRGTMGFVPEVVDLVAQKSPDTLVLAAGGIADGRGLAAALMLGADGVLVGSRFWASAEALVHPAMTHAAINASGDDTIRSSVMDIARKLDWPETYTARVLTNAFTDRWHNDITGLLDVAEAESQRWITAWETGDITVANVFVGEASGLIHDAPPASEIMAQMVTQAEQVLTKGAELIQPIGAS